TDAGPVAQNVVATTDEDHSTVVTAQATVEDAGDSISLATGYSADALSAHGAAISYNGDGTFSYDPTGAAYFETLPVGQTTDTFQYTVTDNHGVSSTATATVTVNITDAGPVAQNVVATTDEDHSTVVTAQATVEDAGDSISLATGYSADALSAHGAAISYNGDGTFSYDPTGAAYFETLPVGQTTDTFQYTVTDNHGV